ncbi:MAG: hypothetical protein PWQ57_2903 [Desulfovibrionales bacterium]|jgi:hypothetical protein|nr:hypothetical protein [Desulfovibrionales bacterium]
MSPERNGSPPPKKPKVGNEENGGSVAPAENGASAPRGKNQEELQEWIEQRVEVPDGVNEEYYQISPEILDCFPKYVFPIDLYRLKEDIASLVPVYKTGVRVDSGFRAMVYQRCREGLIFVSRMQHGIYTKFISQQPDMVLLDKNLLPTEIAAILMVSLRQALEEFYDQMVGPRLNDLRKVVGILVEYVIQKPERMDAFICTVHELSTIENKSVNVCFAAMALYMRYYGGRINVHTLEKVALGFILHDIGMTRIPKFVTEKERMLNPEERRRVKEHPLEAVEVLRNLDLTEEPHVLPAMQHHERMDGGGYPNRLRGDQISILGRMAAVADSYVAMITERPFSKEKKPLLAAVELLKDQTSYDIRITSLLVKILQEVTC